MFCGQLKILESFTYQKRWQTFVFLNRKGRAVSGPAFSSIQFYLSENITDELCPFSDVAVIKYVPTVIPLVLRL